MGMRKKKEGDFFLFLNNTKNTKKKYLKTQGRNNFRKKK
jgi:hypothetical protein